MGGRNTGSITETPLPLEWLAKKGEIIFSVKVKPIHMHVNLAKLKWTILIVTKPGAPISPSGREVESTGEWG